VKMVWHFNDQTSRWKLVLTVDLTVWYIPESTGFESGEYLINGT